MIRVRGAQGDVKQGGSKMRVALLADAAGLSDYLAEILRAWGLSLFDMTGPDALKNLDPDETRVVICPASRLADQHGAWLAEYAERGGTVVCFTPGGELASAAGVEIEGEKEPPLRLRLTDLPVGGVAGEALPVVGRGDNWRIGPDARPLAWLYHPGRGEGESAGIVERRIGRGRIVAYAFDLARCVLLLRQGDPARAERIPPGDRVARPSHMAMDIGPDDSGRLPFADLLGRSLVEITRRSLGGPAPMVSHLPGAAAGVALYSGDEDGASVEQVEAQLDEAAASGGRMSLYVAMWRDNSKRADVDRYRVRNDVGPQPCPQRRVVLRHGADVVLHRIQIDQQGWRGRVGEIRQVWIGATRKGFLPAKRG